MGPGDRAVCVRPEPEGACGQPGHNCRADGLGKVLCAGGSLGPHESNLWPSPGGAWEGAPHTHLLQQLC